MRPQQMHNQSKLCGGQPEPQTDSRTDEQTDVRDLSNLKSFVHWPGMSDTLLKIRYI